VAKPEPGQRRERIDVYIPPSMVDRLRMYCARERMTMSMAVSHALKLWLPTVEPTSASSMHEADKEHKELIDAYSK
jgi:hypothetical protein